MRIVLLVPGTCDVFYCENCLRDDAMVAALSRLGHEVVTVPLYLPALTELRDAHRDAPIFFGGINVYLQQKSALFRRTPRWLDRLLDAPSLLRRVARMAGTMSARGLAETTLSMLRGEEGRQAKELQRLVEWLASQPRPDVVCLSNVLLAGLVRRIKAELHVPVVCWLQDEDSFLDALPEPHRRIAWDALSGRAAEIDAFIPVSDYYGRLMRERLRVPAGHVHVVSIGLELDGYEPAASPPDPPVIGYLSRTCRDKGLALLVEALILLRGNDRLRGLRLRIAGGRTAEDGPFLAEIRARLDRIGLADAVESLPNLGRAQRIEFLRSLSVMSVPTTQPEAFGLYAIEALACGVPFVLPRHGAAPELLEATGGGLLCEPNDLPSLADALGELLLHSEHARALGERGRRVVHAKFDANLLAHDVVNVCEKVVHARADGSA